MQIGEFAILTPVALLEEFLRSSQNANPATHYVPHSYKG